MIKKHYERELTEDELIRRCLQLCQIVDAPAEYATKSEEDFIIASVKIQRDLRTRRLFTPIVLKEYERYGFSRGGVNTNSYKIAKKFLAKRDRAELFLLPFLEEVAGGDFEFSVNCRLKREDENIG